MNKIVNLENLKFCRFTDNTPFTITENDTLTLTFQSKKYNLEGAIVTLINGKIKHFYTLGADGVITPNKDLLQAGLLNINVAGAREWVVDGLKIYEADTELTAEPAFKAFESDYTAKINELGKSLNEYKNAVTDTIEGLSKQLAAQKVYYDEQIKTLINRITVLENK